MSKAGSLLFLLEGYIELEWIFNLDKDQQVKVHSMSLQGNKLTLRTNFTGSLEGNQDFLKQFKQRIGQKGIEGNVSFVKESPANIIGDTDKVNRIVGYNHLHLTGPAYVRGSVVLKVDDEMAKGIKGWYE